MIAKIRKGEDRGHVDFDWLKSAHSFSFGEYYDPNNIGFGALRVINDDEIAFGSGFPSHSHKNMEIFTIPLSGSLSHKDSTGSASTIKMGDVQITSAGTGVFHSEFNASKVEYVSLLQIWITPRSNNVPPRYEEKFFPFFNETEKLHRLITPHGADGSLTINQDAYVSMGRFVNASKVSYSCNAKNNGIYLFVVEGSARVDTNVLQKRDAAEITEINEFSIEVKKDTLILIIEVPMKE